MVVIQAEVNQSAHIVHAAMGTVMSHRVFGPGAQDTLQAVVCEVERLERLLSRFIPDSDISRINYSAGLNAVKVSPETLDVLSGALTFAQSFPGYLDVTIAPLVSLWKNSQNLTNPPPDADIQKLLSLVNSRDLDVDLFAHTAFLRRSEQSIDLGGIGKGYVADRLLDVFRDHGITSAFSNLGGNVVTLGTKPGGQAWQIGIQHPRKPEQLIGAVSVSNQSVVTSGDYQRYFVDGRGKRYHHILDPKTGYPAESGLSSVTILSTNSIEADALSTMVFVAGLGKGKEVLRKYPQLEAVLVDTEMDVFISPGLVCRFKPEEDIRVRILELKNENQGFI